MLAGFSVLLGMSVVLAFRGEPKPKAKPPGESSWRSPAPAEPSQRVSIGGAQATEAASVFGTGSPSTGVDPFWARQNRDAIARLEKGDLAGAVAGFEACVTAVPADPVFQQNLAEALARLAIERADRGGIEGQREALGFLERAARLAPERKDIAERLTRMRALATSEQGLHTESSGHFDLSYDGAREDLSFQTTEVFEALEGAYLDFCELFGFDPMQQGRARIRVVLYKRDGFHGATGIGHWAGGLYDGSIRVPLEDLGKESATLRRVLRHELVHAFVHESGGKQVPGWLNEGLAQLLEHGGRGAPEPVLAGARKRIAGQAFVPLEDLSGSLSALGDAEAIARAYAQSLLFLDYLAREQGERVLFEMVAGCKEAGPAAAFERRTGLALATAFGDFATSLR
jgi:hypothetical protein